MRNLPTDRRPGSKQEKEILWRRKLEAARVAYKSASLDGVKSLEDFLGRTVPCPDGAMGFRQAQQLENACLQEYTRVLRILVDLVVRDKEPPKE